MGLAYASSARIFSDFKGAVSTPLSDEEPHSKYSLKASSICMGTESAQAVAAYLALCRDGGAYGGTTKLRFGIPACSGLAWAGSFSCLLGPYYLPTAVGRRTRSTRRLRC